MELTLNIKPNPERTNYEKRIAEKAEAIRDWLERDGMRAVRVYWRLFGGIPDIKRNECNHIDMEVGMDEENAKAIGNAFKKAGYYVYECVYSRAYDTSTHVLITKTPVINQSRAMWPL